MVQGGTCHPCNVPGIMGDRGWGERAGCTHLCLPVPSATSETAARSCHRWQTCWRYRSYVHWQFQNQSMDESELQRKQSAKERAKALTFLALHPSCVLLLKRARLQPQRCWGTMVMCREHSCIQQANTTFALVKIRMHTFWLSWLEFQPCDPSGPHQYALFLHGIISYWINYDLAYCSSCIIVTSNAGSACIL